MLFSRDRSASSGTKAVTTTPPPSAVYLGDRVQFDKDAAKDKATGRILFTGDEHILLIGPTRSGKGRRLIAPNLILDAERSALVVDPKGELAAWTAAYRKSKGHEVFFLDPFGVLGKFYPQLKAPVHGFNPLLALDPKSPDFVDDAMGIAEALVIVDGRDPHWSTSAQDLVAGLVMQECAEQTTQPRLSNVRRMLIKSQDTISILATDFCTNPLHEAIPNKLEKYRSANDNRELASVISSAQTQTRFLDSPLVAANLADGDIDFQRMKSEKITVYLVIPPARIVTHAKWLRLVIGAAIRGLQKTARNPSRPDVMLILDEFPQLGRMESVETSMALNAGYGIKIFAVIQHMNQLKQQYDDNWETFISGGVVVSFAPRDVFTAEYLSKLAGQEQVTVSSESYSTKSFSINDNKQFQPVVQPRELQQMQRGRLIIFMPTENGQQIFRSSAPDFSEVPEINKHIRE